MPSVIIDKKTQQTKFGVWPLQERIAVTLELIHIGNQYFDIHYTSLIQGIKRIEITKMEIPADGNGTMVIAQKMKVRVQLSKYQQAQHHIAMHVHLEANLPIFGKKTIYSQNLEGYHLPFEKSDIPPLSIKKT